jgi:hypothetical protein
MKYFAIASLLLCSMLEISGQTSPIFLRAIDKNNDTTYYRAAYNGLDSLSCNPRLYYLKLALDSQTIIEFKQIDFSNTFMFVKGANSNLILDGNLVILLRDSVIGYIEVRDFYSSNASGNISINALNNRPILDGNVLKVRISNIDEALLIDKLLSQQGTQ